jgi:hypothetical protein
LFPLDFFSHRAWCPSGCFYKLLTNYPAFPSISEFVYIFEPLTGIFPFSASSG